jgi:mannose/fructose/sorbose-specific phosphotransferase system IIA component
LLGIIVATHSNLARGLREAVEMIDGPQEYFDVVPFCEGEDITFLAERIRTIAAAYEEHGEPYVVVTDMFGATPFNAALAGLSAYNTGILAGANLSMLMELVTQRQSCNDYKELLNGAVDAALQNICSVMVRDVFSAGKEEEV